jgi:hypothetical protein
VRLPPIPICGPSRTCRACLLHGRCGGKRKLSRPTDRTKHVQINKGHSVDLLWPKVVMQPGKKSHVLCHYYILQMTTGSRKSHSDVRNHFRGTRAVGRLVCGDVAYRTVPTAHISS